MSASGQLPLPFAVAPALGREDFLAGKANEAALAQIERWPRWLSQAAVLVGPEGSGKSHLAAIFAQTSGAHVLRTDHLTFADVPSHAIARALVLEDADRFHPDERALFHLMNLARESGMSLLLTARSAPDHWGIATPDLLSRLRAQPLQVLAEPDDQLLSALMVKLFADRQLTVSPEAVSYALARIDRSYRAVQIFVARVDQETLIRKGSPTRRLLASVLGEGLTDEEDEA
jgi:chromosomal replication initiation ATPase DnaA